MAGEVDPALIGLEQGVLVGRLVEVRARASFSEGTPVSRPRARLMVARSSGRPSRLLRSALVTNSSISLPTWRVMPRMMAPAAMSSSMSPSAPCEGGRVEEALDQADVVGVEVRIEVVDRLGQHRVAEAIDHVRELGDDRRIDRGVEAVGHQEDVDGRLDLAGELLEHEVLILHLGAELGRLEQAFAVPDQGRDSPAQRRRSSIAATRSDVTACAIR